MFEPWRNSLEIDAGMHTTDHFILHQSTQAGIQIDAGRLAFLRFAAGRPPAAAPRGVAPSAPGNPGTAPWPAELGDYLEGRGALN
uniref:Uncharacterized protein n=1 Tax=Arundo donax TaxID=35708 RepID=A0A0A9AU38_ARUDO